MRGRDSTTQMRAGTRFAAAAGILVAFGACTGSPIASERAARDELAAVTSRYRPGDARPELPALGAETGIDDYVRFALLNSPRVEAAYYAWAAAVEQITTARSRPDPRLTFSVDIARMVASVVAGLMADLPGPGKLQAAGDVAAADGGGRYAEFEAEILRAAAAVKTACYRRQFLDDAIRLQRETLGVLGELEQAARQQNAAARATLQDVLRSRIEREQLETRIEDLEDSRGTLVAELKAALGLGPADADPPIPARLAPSAEAPDREAILESALRRNPAIRAVAADVRRATAALDLARTAGVPDFTAGVEADAKGSMWSTSAGLTLPIWRDKTAAMIAGAQAGKREAEARLRGEQVELAAQLATTLFVYRQSVRAASLLDERLVPLGRQSLEAARTGYANGTSGFLDVIDAQRQLLAFELAFVEARANRELALVSLSLLIAGVPPQGSPALSDAERSGRAEPEEIP